MMKKMITLALALALILTLTACTSAAPAISPSAPPSPSDGVTQNPEAVDTARTVRIAKTEGDSAAMLKGGNQFTAKEGLTLGGGDAAITGEASYIYLNLNSQSVLIMDEDSLVEVEKISEKSLSLTLVEGAISADITRENADDTYEIRAGNTTLGIRGTRFVVEYRGGALAIYMLEGSGEVEGVLLTEGHMARIEDGEVVIEPFDAGGAYSAFVNAAINGEEIAGGDGPTPPDPNGNGDSIPDNGTPPTVTATMESHAGDKGYFYIGTDDYIVWADKINPADTILPYHTRYIVASFDNNGKRAAVFLKYIFANEADAMAWANDNNEYKTQIDNIGYLNASDADFMGWWDKASCFTFVQNDANNFDYYISKP